MDIHAISYTNIGPFAWKTVTVQFSKWAYLIKSPIWSGKSFLFFDWPIFALYKYASRQMLSRTKKHGTIRCIFTHNETTLLVERSITPTKAGNDSVKSRLYTIGKTGEEIEAYFGGYKPLEWGQDLCKGLQKQAEEIEFANQREFEDTLSDYLPAREVMTAVYIMMQDSDHVFSLPPAERVTIFKHLFGMLGIDEGKDRLQKTRRELQWELTAVKNDLTANDKLSTAVSTIKSIQSFFEDTDFDDAIQKVRDRLVWKVWLLSDTALLTDKLTLEWLTISDDESWALSEALNALDALRLSVAKNESTLESLQERKAKHRSALEKTRTDIQEAKRALEAIENKLKAYDRSWLDALQDTKKRLDQSITTIKSSFSAERFAEFWIESDTLEDAHSTIHSLKEQWEKLKNEKELFDLRIKQFDQAIKEYTSKKADLDERIKILSNDLDEKKKFHCDLIEWDCPYVEAIKWSAVRSIHNQLEKAQQQRTYLNKEYQEKWYTKQIETMRTKLQGIDEQLEKTRAVLVWVKWKKIEELYKELQKLYTQRSEVGTKITALEEKQWDLSWLQEEKTTLTSKIQLLSEQQDTIQTELSQVEQKISDLSEHTSPVLAKQIQTAGEKIQMLMRIIDRIESLIADYNEKKQNKQYLEDRIQKVKALYQIFSKELLVVVLQDFLPQLEDVINAFLAQVVAYEVRFASPKNVDDSLELDITIIDEHWEREVRSLSWGQKAILKICWILAVASLMNSKFLFLDETITSLDASAVWRVWTLLKQFVKKNAMKLYVVTHAQQIQEMDLWDDIVGIENSTGK